MNDDNIIHFNPWRDFNDAVTLVEPEVDPDSAQIAIFLDLVFGCHGRQPAGYAAECHHPGADPD